MKKYIWISVSAVWFLIFVFPGISFSLGHQNPDSNDVVVSIGSGASINHTKNLITVEGIGASPTNVTDLGRRKAMARRAAELDAYRKILEAVQSVRVTARIKAKKIMDSSPSVYARVSGMIRGMQTKHVKYSNDGLCKISMEANFDRVGNLLLKALDSGDIKITDNYPKIDWVKAREEVIKKEKLLAAGKAELKRKTEEENSLIQKKWDQLEIQQKELDAEVKKKRSDIAKEYEILNNKKEAIKPENQTFTGLIIDARNTGLEPALAPRILNEKLEEAYGLNTNSGEHSKGYIASYLPGDIEFAKKQKDKIGENPMIVKCIKTHENANVIISNKDAANLQLIVKSLEQNKVAILI